ncbi:MULTISPECIES: hypothetical protein [Halostella]|uniref:hypothetical protein n=1 Tax=Halostella TaxID=1843185 RepID=UPI001081B8C5|nr:MULTISPECIES: hypothetical protein [Halostella]
MIRRVYLATLFALYQISLAVGIMLMPFALAMSRAGVVLPVHRIIENLGDAYQNAAGQAR